MAGPEPWASDPNVPDRQPAHCPYCGQGGSFGGLGTTATATEDRYRHHCPECGYEFITITPTEDS